MYNKPIVPASAVQCGLLRLVFHRLGLRCRQHPALAHPRLCFCSTSEVEQNIANAKDNEQRKQSERNVWDAVQRFQEREDKFKEFKQHKQEKKRAAKLKKLGIDEKELEEKDKVPILPLSAKAYLMSHLHEYCAEFSDVIDSEGNLCRAVKEEENSEEVKAQQFDPVYPFQQRTSFISDSVKQSVQIIREKCAPSSLDGDEQSETEEDSIYEDVVDSLEYDAIRLELIQRKVAEDKRYSNLLHMYRGLPDPSVPVSSVPCRGCGAMLHCRDPAIPGYIPSQKYKSFLGVEELSETLCQRCNYMVTFDVALKAHVPEEEWFGIVSKIKSTLSLVILMIDVTDIPCSIPPNFLDLIGSDKPLVVVANKVDLLIKDESKYLSRILDTVKRYINDSGLVVNKNVKHVQLISAKTGYGVEDLITNLQNLWNIKGDVYLLGAANVGKSSLFNAFLQSDYCKTQAKHLIHKATVSMWPGTTLNLLKFPILRPTPWRQWMRMRRLRAAREADIQERHHHQHMLRYSYSPKYATLMGHIGSTFKEPEAEDEDQQFDHKVSSSYALSSGSLVDTKQQVTKPDLNDPMFKGRWFYDTPGTLLKDQIITQLTSEELLLTLPKSIIIPRTYILWPERTLFLAGLARLDYIQGNRQVLLTVFSHNSLPINVRFTVEADSWYSEKLLSGELQVPTANSQRLRDYPPLIGKQLDSAAGLGYNKSCCDVVFSSACWMAVTAQEGDTPVFRAWIPGGHGIFLRCPSLLPFAVNLRGRRKKHTPAYAVKQISTVNY